MSTLQEMLPIIKDYPRSPAEDKQTWADFLSFIVTYELEEKITKPLVFDTLRQKIYTQHNWVETSAIIYQLNTLSDEELRLLLSYMISCRLLNSIHQNIQIFIPCEVVDFYISRFMPSL
jgi:hypothetical protein